MSLKAKIEAVIYASEEPVTLAQLIGLLGEEAQAELDALTAQQQSLTLADSADDDEALNAEILEAPEEPEPSEGSPAFSEPPDDAAATPGAPGPDSRTRETAPQIPEEAPNPEPTTPTPQDPAEARAREAAAKLEARTLRDYFRSLIAGLIADYANNDRGLEIREVAGGFRLATKPEYHDAVRGFVKSLKPPLKLSLQALETLAVVAYKQPITAPEISEIRGVDSGGVLGSLLTRKLITTAGRKQVIGRPILYKTTKDFLLRFGLKDINELPSIEEFEKMAGELNSELGGAVQEEIPMDAPPVDESNAVPQPTYPLHDSIEGLMSDDSTAPEGSHHEPIQPDQVEPIGDTHTPQADGIPNNGGSGDPKEAFLDNVVVDGRESGLPPDYSADEADDPSAQEALEQAKEEDLKTSTPG